MDTPGSARRPGKESGLLPHGSCWVWLGAGELAWTRVRRVWKRRRGLVRVSCGEASPFEGELAEDSARKGRRQAARHTEPRCLAWSGPSWESGRNAGCLAGPRPVESQPALSEEPGDLGARSNLKVPSQDTLRGTLPTGMGRGAVLREAEEAEGWVAPAKDSGRARQRKDSWQVSSLGGRPTPWRRRAGAARGEVDPGFGRGHAASGCLMLPHHPPSLLAWAGDSGPVVTPTTSPAPLR